MRCYLGEGLVSLAGDEHDEGPVMRVHEHSSRLGTGGVVRRRAAAMGTLDTTSCQLGPSSLLTHLALLMGGEGERLSSLGSRTGFHP